MHLARLFDCTVQSKLDSWKANELDSTRREILASTRPDSSSLSSQQPPSSSSYTSSYTSSSTADSSKNALPSAALRSVVVDDADASPRGGGGVLSSSSSSSSDCACPSRDPYHLTSSLVSSLFVGWSDFVTRAAELERTTEQTPVVDGGGGGVVVPPSSSSSSESASAESESESLSPSYLLSLSVTHLPVTLSQSLRHLSDAYALSAEASAERANHAERLLTLGMVERARLRAEVMALSKTRMTTTPMTTGGSSSSDSVEPPGDDDVTSTTTTLSGVVVANNGVGGGGGGGSSYHHHHHVAASSDAAAAALSSAYSNRIAVLEGTLAAARERSEVLLGQLAWRDRELELLNARLEKRGENKYDGGAANKEDDSFRSPASKWSGSGRSSSSRDMTATDGTKGRSLHPGSLLVGGDSPLKTGEFWTWLSNVSPDGGGGGGRGVCGDDGDTTNNETRNRNDPTTLAMLQGSLVKTSVTKSIETTTRRTTTTSKVAADSATKANDRTDIDADPKRDLFASKGGIDSLKEGLTFVPPFPSDADDAPLDGESFDFGAPEHAILAASKCDNDAFYELDHDHDHHGGTSSSLDLSACNNNDLDDTLKNYDLVSRLADDAIRNHASEGVGGGVDDFSFQVSPSKASLSAAADSSIMQSPTGIKHAERLAQGSADLKNELRRMLTLTGRFKSPMQSPDEKKTPKQLTTAAALSPPRGDGGIAEVRRALAYEQALEGESSAAAAAVVLRAAKSPPLAASGAAESEVDDDDDDNDGGGGGDSRASTVTGSATRNDREVDLLERTVDMLAGSVQAWRERYEALEEVCDDLKTKAKSPMREEGTMSTDNYNKVSEEQSMQLQLQRDEVANTLEEERSRHGDSLSARESELAVLLEKHQRVTSERDDCLAKLLSEDDRSAQALAAEQHDGRQRAELERTCGDLRASLKESDERLEAARGDSEVLAKKVAAEREQLLEKLSALEAKAASLSEAAVSSTSIFGAEKKELLAKLSSLESALSKERDELRAKQEGSSILSDILAKKKVENKSLENRIKELETERLRLQAMLTEKSKMAAAATATATLPQAGARASGEGEDPSSASFQKGYETAKTESIDVLRLMSADLTAAEESAKTAAKEAAKYKATVSTLKSEVENNAKMAAKRIKDVENVVAKSGIVGEERRMLKGDNYTLEDVIRITAVAVLAMMVAFFVSLRTGLTSAIETRL